MKANLSYFIFFVLISSFYEVFAEEMIFGEETIAPGFTIVFEAAPKDTIFPESYFLDESSTDVHIEMLINWSDKSPTGSPVGGFIPYLDVTATIENMDGNSQIVKLTPHINIVDNFHYAQNIKLPGETDDTYDLIFEINPPDSDVLGIHYDWKKKYQHLVNKKTFKYHNLNFQQIAKATRR